MKAISTSPRSSWPPKTGYRSTRHARPWSTTWPGAFSVSTTCRYRLGLRDPNQPTKVFSKTSQIHIEFRVLGGYIPSSWQNRFLFVQGGRWCGVIHDHAGGQMVSCPKAMLQGEASCEWKEFIFLIPMQVPTWKWELWKLGFILPLHVDSRNIFFVHTKKY